MDELNVSKGIFRADRLKEVMQAHGATIHDITDVARQRFNSDTVNRGYYNDILEDKQAPDIEDLYIICKAVNVSADYLLGLSDKVN